MELVLIIAVDYIQMILDYQLEESQINRFSIFQRLTLKEILPINGLSYNQINTIRNKLNLLII